MNRLIDDAQQATSSAMRELLAEAKRHWLPAAIFAIACLAAAAVISVAAPRVYRAEVLLSPVSSDEASSDIAAMLGGLGNVASLVGLGRGDASREEAIATLGSRQLARDFIIEHDLMNHLFAVEAGSRWDPARNQWEGDLTGSEPTVNDALQEFDEDIRSVKLDRRSGLVTLRFEWSDREQVAEWANEFVQRANRVIQQRAVAESQRSIQYLQQELARVSEVEVQQAIFRLIEKQMQKAMLASTRDEFAFRIIDPASVPDVDEQVFPRASLLLPLGAVLGLLGGGVLAFGLAALRPQGSGT